MNFLGIDLGGTTVKYALISLSGELSEKGDFPTESKNAEELLDKLVVLIESYKDKFGIKGVGISCPGVIDPYKGKVVWASSNMPKGWHQANIKEYLQSKTDLLVSVDNDVNCAALGEKWLGAAQTYHTFICIAMGTGIGSGIVINDKLYYGAGFQAGEIGYIRANKGATMFWERYASTLALVKRMQESLSLSRLYDQEIIEQIDGQWIFDNAETNSQVASILDDWADHLAKGIADAACILNPEAIILGGGVSAQGDNLLNLIVPKVQSYLPTGFIVDVKIATTGNDAGKIGAVKKIIDELAE